MLFNDLSASDMMSLRVRVNENRSELIFSDKEIKINLGLCVLSNSVRKLQPLMLGISVALRNLVRLRRDKGRVI